MSNEEKILELLQAMQSSMAAMETRLDNLETKVDRQKEEIIGEVRILMESYFGPRFNALAEKMDVLEGKMIPAEAMETVEDRVDVLEAVVKQHSREIRELKKAQ